MGLTEKVIGEKENAADGCGGDALPGVLQWMSLEGKAPEMLLLPQKCEPEGLL